MAVLGVGALAALKGYLWVQDGEYLKASLLGLGSPSPAWRWRAGDGGAGSRPATGSTTRC